MKENLINKKTYDFSLKIIKLNQFLTNEKKEYVMSKQILKSGTSIGANIEESTGSQSKRDFLSKISISYKEARETLYWLNLLLDSNYISKELGNNLQNDCIELLRIIGKIQLTTKHNLRNS
jgi:four helix bundle protein